MKPFQRLVFALSLAIPASAPAQRQADVDAINRLIDRYGALEDSMDLRAQAQLMSADRVLLAPGAGRRTDQAANMRSQQAAAEQQKKRIPGLQTFTDNRDRLIKFYGNGSVAVASFYRYTAAVLPAGTPAEVAKDFEPPAPAGITLVLEKRESDWKIVHTHVSPLAACN